MTLTKAKSAPTVRGMKKASSNGHAAPAVTIGKKIPGWMKAVAASKAKRAALREIKEAREKFAKAAKEKQQTAVHEAPANLEARNERGQVASDKPWVEITPAQQMERMRGIVKFMESKLEAMRQRMEMFEQHQHGPMGQLFVPYNRYEIEDRMRGHFAETKKREEMFF